MKQLFDDDRRGQVGIGTLIVFIAMVLVAAIAAGVLINTAGFLQNQAENTGTESTEQVADNLNVITEVGEVNYDDNINELRVGVQPASGADDINLAELTVQYVSDGEFENLVVGPTTEGDSLDDSQATGDTAPNSIFLSTDTDQATYRINVITAENEGDVVMTDSADRYELVIPLGVTSSNFGELDSGGPFTATVTSPGTLSPGETLDLDVDDTLVEIVDVTDTGAGTASADNFAIADPDPEANSGTGPVIEYVGDSETTIDGDLDVDYESLATESLDQASLQPLDEGEEVELTITTEVGSQTVAFLQVPDSLSGEDSGSTVNL